MNNILKNKVHVIARRMHFPTKQPPRRVGDCFGQRTRTPSQRHQFVSPLFILTLILSLVLSTSAKKASALQIDVPLDQALVYSGGESTNLRDYDPATTYSAGNKLVFSGLVSFDPRLNLTPDLAETWDVSGDGMVYTFYLRENARFHDGRFVTAKDVVYSWERAASPQLASDTV